MTIHTDEQVRDETKVIREKEHGIRVRRERRVIDGFSADRAIVRPARLSRRRVGGGRVVVDDGRRFRGDVIVDGGRRLRNDVIVDDGRRI